jgi:hypothetical protein
MPDDVKGRNSAHRPSQLGPALARLLRHTYGPASISVAPYARWSRLMAGAVANPARWQIIGRLFSASGTGVVVALVAIPLTISRAINVTAACLTLFGAWIVGVTVIIVSEFVWSFPLKNRVRVGIGAASVLGVLLFGVGLFENGHRQSGRLGNLADGPIMPIPPEVPDVTLRFVYAKAPALLLINKSGKLAKQIRWIVKVWDLDDPTTEPLPIKIDTVDFLRPHSTSGPQNLLGSVLVAPFMKPGHQLFGWASVVCPDCARGHTFFVYIEWGKGGWYYEIASETSGDIFIPKHLTASEVKAYFVSARSMMPQGARIPITDDCCL